MNVLVVDDSPDIGLLVSLNLQSEGHETEVRLDGSLVTDEDIAWADAVVTDLAMPRQTGADVAERVRRAGSNMPVIVLTATPMAALDAETRSRLIAADVAWLEKPHASKAIGDLLRGQP